MLLIEKYKIHETKKTPIELQGEINKPKIKIGALNTPLSITGRTSKQKIRKDTEDLNNTTNQTDLTDIYKTLYLSGEEKKFLLSIHRTLTKIVHILGHKASLEKFKSLQVTQNMTYGHNLSNLKNKNSIIIKYNSICQFKK